MIDWMMWLTEWLNEWMIDWLHLLRVQDSVTFQSEALSRYKQLVQSRVVRRVHSADAILQSLGYTYTDLACATERIPPCYTVPLDWRAKNCLGWCVSSFVLIHHQSINQSISQTEWWSKSCSWAGRRFRWRLSIRCKLSELFHLRRSFMLRGLPRGKSCPVWTGEWSHCQRWLHGYSLQVGLLDVYEMHRTSLMCAYIDRIYIQLYTCIYL